MTKSGIFKCACRAWRGVSRRLWFVLCMTVVLPAPSCRSMKEDTSIRVVDSLRWDRKVSATLVTTPLPPVRLTAPLDSLRKLPSGAVYTSSSGGLRVTAKVKGDSLCVTAEAEGPSRLEYREEESRERVRGEQSETVTVKEPATESFWTRFKGYSKSILTGIILTIIIQIIYKLWQRKQRRSV
ncbi:hypothetical protein NBH15_13705 [Parabacteroides sp. W1-Q-101]|uniref:hypothetical protein n=1 Tax=Parabacteroides caeci TaxID=2949650 RepID=UPI00202E7695|nr:hypothetical protein [Parabacteroides sp. W1-Q-101]MCM0719327.1 hypothetical protein [Parabacteroides sp. W1-Q-101]